MAPMQLTPYEKALLAGEQGPAYRRAMEIIVALGEIYGARGTVPIGSAQISGISYRNIGQAGLDFLKQWASEGARVSVPAMMNPAGMDLQRWREMGIPREFARRQQEVVETLVEMGVQPTLTCAPYLLEFRPRPGEHVAWAESSAVSFVNSVLGARTNREGGPSALAAAIVGRTARYGLHTDEGRNPTHLIEVRCPVVTEADFGALGYTVGRAVRGGIPFLRFRTEFHPTWEGLRAMGAAMAASGAVALYHVDGLTPEAEEKAQELSSLPPERILEVSSLDEAYRALSTPLDEVDLVWIGCPHASPEQIEHVASMVQGRTLATRLWITTGREVSRKVAKAVEVIEATGGLVLTDTCLVVAPVEVLGIKRVATNSAKAAFYLPSYAGVKVHFASLERCIQIALRQERGK